MSHQGSLWLRNIRSSFAEEENVAGNIRDVYSYMLAYLEL